MTSLRDSLDAARKLFPWPPLAALASLFFTLAVLTSPFTDYLTLKLYGTAFYAFAVHWLIYRPPFHFPPIKLPLAAFLWANLASIIFAATQPLYRLTWYFLLILGILVLASNVIVKALHLEAIFKALFLVSVVSGLLGVWQFAREYRTVLAEHPYQVYNYMTAARFFIRGFTVYPVQFGCQQMLFLAALAAFLLFSGRARPIGWVAFTVIGLSILLNLTRSVWVGCFAAGLYLLARWRPRWLWLTPIVLAVSYFAAPSLIRLRVKSALRPSTDLSAAHRLELWGVGLRMIRKHPWMGVGPGNIDSDYGLYLLPGQVPIPFRHYHLHNNFLQLAAERGLPTLAAWIALMVALLWGSWKVRPQLSRLKWVPDAAIAAWIALVAQGLFDYNFGLFPVVAPYLFLASTPFVAQEIENPSYSIRVLVRSKEKVA